MKTSHVDTSEQLLLIKKFGTFGFMFFLLKGILWLTLPFLMAYFGLGGS